MQTRCAKKWQSVPTILTETVADFGENVKISSVTEKEKTKGICTEGCPEKYHFLLFLRIHS